MEDFILCVDKILGKEVVARHTHRFEQRIALGDNIVLFARSEIYTHEAIVCSVVVGHNHRLIVVAIEQIVVVLETLEQGAPLALRGALVEQLRTRCTCRRGNKLPLAVFALAAMVVVERVLLILKNQNILLLRSAKAVEIDLLVGVLSRIHTIALLRGIVGTVIEATTIASPRSTRELHPLDMIGKGFHSLGIENKNLHPIRACRGERIGEVATIFGKCSRIECHRAIFREGVGVEKYLLLGVREVALAVDDALILQTAVAGDVVPLATLCRCALRWVVPQLLQSLTNSLALWERVEIAESNLILRLHPLGCALRVVIFEPTIRVGNLRSMVVIYHPLTGCFGIDNLLFHHIFDFSNSTTNTISQEIRSTKERSTNRHGLCNLFVVSFHKLRPLFDAKIQKRRKTKDERREFFRLFLFGLLAIGH